MRILNFHDLDGTAGAPATLNPMCPIQGCLPAELPNYEYGEMLAGLGMLHRLEYG